MLVLQCETEFCTGDRFQTYYVYEKSDGSHLLSMGEPGEWGGGAGPFKRFIAPVKLLARSYLNRDWLV